MSSGRDEWMSRWTEEDKKRNLSSYLGQIPEEFGGVKGVTGKAYQQMEFDFAEPEQLDLGAFGMSDTEFDTATAKKHMDDWTLRHNTMNYILQAKGIINLVMDDIGSVGCGSGLDTHEYALWGASELLQNAADLLE